MKKFFTVLSAAAVLFSFSGCQQEDKKSIPEIPVIDNKGVDSIIQNVKVTGSTFNGGESNTMYGYTGVFSENIVYEIKSFYMGKYEITKAEYKNIMSDAELNTLGISADPSYSSNMPAVYVKAQNEEEEFRAVENVNWYDAVYFCNLMSLKEGLDLVYTITDIKTESKEITEAGEIRHIISANVEADFTKNGWRLPTESEWEFAARGGNPSAKEWKQFYSGTDTKSDSWLYYDSCLDLVGWYWHNSCTENGKTSTADPQEGNAGYGSHQVGKKVPNRLGIHDMSGNVYEWCWDITTLPKNNRETKTGRAVCGGSWASYSYNSCVAHRRNFDPTYSYSITGLRLVRNAE